MCANKSNGATHIHSAVSTSLLLQSTLVVLPASANGWVRIVYLDSAGETTRPAPRCGRGSRTGLAPSSILPFTHGSQQTPAVFRVISHPLVIYGPRGGGARATGERERESEYVPRQSRQLTGEHQAFCRVHTSGTAGRARLEVMVTETVYRVMGCWELTYPRSSSTDWLPGCSIDSPTGPASSGCPTGY